MRARRLVWIAILLAACARSSADRTPEHEARPADRVPIAMTPTDPHDPASWKAAEQLAAKQHAGGVYKRSDALPFLFSADRARCVLVHRGQVISKRGAAVAGAYLRDLGIAQGKGPPLDDVLWTLWALEALPDVEPLGAEGYVHVPDDQRLASLTARIDHDGQAAHIVLHYFKPEAKPARNVHPDSSRGASGGSSGGRTGGSSGGRTGGSSGGRTGGATRELVRATLDIPATGDAAWRREDVRWTDPR
jgi:uncharacterized membrane protein YgcG